MVLHFMVDEFVCGGGKMATAVIIYNPMEVRKEKRNVRKDMERK